MTNGLALRYHQNVCTICTTKALTDKRKADCLSIADDTRGMPAAVPVFREGRGVRKVHKLSAGVGECVGA